MHCQSSVEAASKGLLPKALQLGLIQYTKGGVALPPVLLKQGLGRLMCLLMHRQSPKAAQRTQQLPTQVQVMRVQTQVQSAVGPDVSLLLALALKQPQQLLGELLAPAEGAPEVVPPLKGLTLLQLPKWLMQQAITQLLRRLAGQSAAGPATSSQMSVHLKPLLLMIWKGLLLAPVGMRKM